MNFTSVLWEFSFRPIHIGLAYIEEESYKYYRPIGLDRHCGATLSSLLSREHLK